MDSPETSLTPGYRLERFELLCPIASGGMASVWLARLQGKRGFEKLFAVKTIKTELIADPHFQEMFLDEARIASRIVHPNVAQILELGEQDDILYIVMEFVDGDSVAKVNRLSLKKGIPFPPGVSMRIVSETCAGLHAAHGLKDSDGEPLNVIHRDVSPQNILLTTEGVAKVIDFGLVKARNRAAGETQSGVVKGKIRYMAPEQVASRSLDHRADVWAAGMCLYELVTGHVPYRKDDDLEVVKRLMSDDPLPPFDIALPPQIEKILMKALVKDPEGRFASCGAMRRAIEAAIHELGLQAENDDVTDFIKETLPELAVKRQKTIAKAIESADGRRTATSMMPPAMEAPPQGGREDTDSFDSGLAPHEIGYAPTEVSTREKHTGGDAEESNPVPLVQRRSGIHDDSDPERAVSSYGASRTTSAAAPLRDQLGERKGRAGIAFWLVAVAVVGAGAFILWPRTKPPSTTETTTASSASSTPPPATQEPATSSSSTIELDPLATADAGGVPRVTTGGSARVKPGPSGSAAVATAADAGRAVKGPEPSGTLSPAAMSAAAIMGVTPKPPQPDPPPPPPPLPPE